MFTEEEQLLLDFISENSLLVSLKFYKLYIVSWDFLGLQSDIASKFQQKLQSCLDNSNVHVSYSGNLILA